MRLLNTHTLEMRNFFDSERPKYVILSHRWVAGETSLQDFEAERSQPGRSQSAGVRKVLRFCQLVRESDHYDVDWCWADTCCIDKASSAELTEAINSMYRWYRDAEACYVYMNDLPSKLDRRAPTVLTKRESQLEKEQDPAYVAEQAAALKHELTKSGWFTRGWTLQELLAPRTQYFLDRDWEPVGSRLELASLIEEITGIDRACLGNEMETRRRCAAEKLSWMASGTSVRRTARTEDLSYCLLGIMNVHMPLIYGEGMNAFRRLQEEIIRTSADESIFAWVAGPSFSPFSDSSSSTAPLSPSSTTTATTQEAIRSSFVTTSGGVLASHPANFASLRGSGVRQTIKYFPDRKPFSLTNKGLRFQTYDSTHLHSLQSIDVILNVFVPGKGFVVLRLRQKENGVWNRVERDRGHYADNLRWHPGQGDNDFMARAKIYIEA